MSERTSERVETTPIGERTPKPTYTDPAPQPQPQTKQRGYRSLFWPTLLIGLGAVGLLVTLDIIPVENLTVLFRVWPLFLIAIGADLLLGYRNPVIGAFIAMATLAAVLLVTLAADVVGVSQVGASPSTSTILEPLNGAERANINIDAGLAPVSIGALPADSTSLMEGTIFDTGRVMFEADGTNVREVSLDMEHPDGFSPFIDNVEDRRWDLQLARGIPLAITLDASAGSFDIDFSELLVQSLELDASFGSVDLQLPGDGQQYDLQIDGSAGSVSVDIADGAVVRADNLEMSAGSLDVNIGQDVEGEFVISGGVGSINLTVPQGTALRVKVNDRGVGSVSLPGDLQSLDSNDEGGIWQSDNYAAADHRISVVLDDLGVGSFSLGY